MNTSDADLKRIIRAIEEYELEKQRARRSLFSPVGEFIELMSVALVKVGGGIIDVIRLLIKHLKRDSA